MELKRKSIKLSQTLKLDTETGKSYPLSSTESLSLDYCLNENTSYTLANIKYDHRERTPYIETVGSRVFDIKGIDKIAVFDMLKLGCEIIKTLNEDGSEE